MLAMRDALCAIWCPISELGYVLLSYNADSVLIAEQFV